MGILTWEQRLAFLQASWQDWVPMEDAKWELKALYETSARTLHVCAVPSQLHHSPWGEFYTCGGNNFA